MAFDTMIEELIDIFTLPDKSNRQFIFSWESIFKSNLCRQFLTLKKYRRSKMFLEFEVIFVTSFRLEIEPLFQKFWYPNF